MAGGAMNREVGRPGQATPIVVLEYESTEEAEDRLRRVYEFLLGLSRPPETGSEREELS
jgi:hypothetical protein